MGSERLVYVLRVAMLVATTAALVSRQRGSIVLAIVGEIALFYISGKVTESDWDVASLHLAYLGLLIGLTNRTSTPVAIAAPTATPPETRYTFDDWFCFVLAVMLATIVCFVVERRATDSADEWSYTYQAALFARGHAYAAAPQCWSSFQNFWVFEAGGRNFSQYTPGWPLFMTPFFMLRMIWLAGPVSLGLFVVGVARLARRASSGHAAGTLPPRRMQVRAAGWFAALATLLSAMMLINGGSRFPHVFVGATFAWAVEWLCVMTTKGISRERQWEAGLLCGAAAMLTASTRPPDGMTLGIGMLAYAIYALGKKKLPWRAIAGTLASFTLVAGITLIILRLQLGKWFATGYSLNDTFHPWNKFGFSMPGWNELKAGVPLATGSYCWWPCSPAVGLAGMALLQGSARRIAVIMFISTLAFVGFYEAIEFGRHINFGYGPRFQLPLIVQMAVGVGVMLGHLWVSPSRGSIAVAIAAALVGVVRIVPLLYPYTYANVSQHDALHFAIEDAHLTNAVVYATRFNSTDVRDMTENLPLDLYPNQDVVVAIDLSASSRQCVEATYPHRAFYRVLPGPPLRLERVR